MTSGGKPPRRGRPRPRGTGDRRPRQEAPRRRVPRAVRIGVQVAPGEVVEHAEQFRVLEADAGLEFLTDRVVGPWVDRTPEGFVVDVRAHRLLTQHPAPTDSLPPDVRDALSPSVRARRQVYAGDLPARALDLALDRFLRSLLPLQEFGKLGAVIFPFPSYFQPSPRAYEYLGWLRERAPDMPLAAEFRHREWVDSRHRDETMRHLQELRIAFVGVDVPPGFPSSLPPLAHATTDLAIVRFHGRDGDAWERGVDSGDDRVDYEYRRAELEPWRARLTKLAGAVPAVHVLFTTGTAGAAGRDARLLVRVLTEEPGAEPPAPPATGPRRRRRR